MTAGRPTKLNDITQAKVCDALRRGATHKLAAMYAGIGRSTFQRYLARGAKEESGIYRDFKDAVTRAETEGAMSLLDMIKAAATEDSREWRAAAWLLERRYPDQYGKAVVVSEEDAERSVLLDAARRDVQEKLAPHLISKDERG